MYLFFLVLANRAKVIHFYVNDKEVVMMWARRKKEIVEEKWLTTTTSKMLKQD